MWTALKTDGVNRGRSDKLWASPVDVWPRSGPAADSKCKCKHGLRLTFAPTGKDWPNTTERHRRIIRDRRSASTRQTLRSEAVQRFKRNTAAKRQTVLRRVGLNKNWTNEAFDGEIHSVTVIKYTNKQRQGAVSFKMIVSFRVKVMGSTHAAAKNNKRQNTELYQRKHKTSDARNHRNELQQHKS